MRILSFSAFHCIFLSVAASATRRTRCITFLSLIPLVVFGFVFPAKFPAYKLLPPLRLASVTVPLLNIVHNRCLLLRQTIHDFLSFINYHIAREMLRCGKIFFLEASSRVLRFLQSSALRRIATIEILLITKERLYLVFRITAGISLRWFCQFALKRAVSVRCVFFTRTDVYACLPVLTFRISLITKTITQK